MSEPKSWDGISQIGSHFSRALDRLGEAKSDFTTEFREDGTLGQVAIKQRAGVNHVHREGGPPPTAEPFLSSWQAPQVFLLDEKMPYQKRNFNLVGTEDDADARIARLKTFGNCHFIGDGFSAGLAYIPTVFRDDGFIMERDYEVLLMRLPRPNVAVPVALYREASTSRRKSLSVRMPFAFGRFQGDPPFDAYTIPLGWKDETARYMFAVVLTYSVEYVMPRIWIGSTGTMELTEVVPVMPPGWDWEEVRYPNAAFEGYDAPSLSQVFCTGPGRLEMVIARPDRFYATGWDVLSGGVGTAVIRNTNLNTFSPRPVEHFYTYSTREPIRPQTFLLSSVDFGTTWTAEHKSEFENGRAVGNLLTSRNNLAGPLTPYDETRAPPAPVDLVDFVSYVFTPPVNRGHEEVFNITWLGPPPPVLLIASRRPVFSPRRDHLATFAAAGSVTFALVTEHPPVDLPPLRNLQRVFNMYRRVGAGVFERISWPRETLPIDTSIYAGTVAGPTQPLAWNGTRSGQLRSATEGNSGGHQNDIYPYTNAWISTGEGRVAFFFVTEYLFAFNLGLTGNEPVIMIATADGGETWVSRTILNSLHFRESVLLPAGRDRGPKRGATILYVEINPVTGVRQLMRISEDFATTAPYGRPYPVPPRAGIINFQKYVHPGFPGLYDGPHAQPPRAT